MLSQEDSTPVRARPHGEADAGLTEDHKAEVGPALPLSDDETDRLGTLLKLLSDRTRLSILGLLGEGETNVGMLCKRLALPQPTVSHHLGLLRGGGLIRPRREGKQVFYRLDTRVGHAVLPRDGEGGVDLNGSTHRVGRHPTGLQIAQDGFAVQIVTDRAGER